METNSRKIIRRLQKEGWFHKSTRGSHHKYEKDGAIIVVPHPKKDLPIGTARQIYRAAGWPED